MKNAVFWDVTPCTSCEMNRRFGRTSVHFTGSTLCHIPEDGILQVFYCRPEGLIQKIEEQEEAEEEGKKESLSHQNTKSPLIKSKTESPEQ
jgi:hypothetical protein